jgi:hypothetical protein
MGDAFERHQERRKPRRGNDEPENVAANLKDNKLLKRGP